jgi:hypothetical protein
MRKVECRVVFGVQTIRARRKTPPSPTQWGKVGMRDSPPTLPLDMDFIARFHQPRGTKERINAKTQRHKDAEFFIGRCAIASQRPKSAGEARATKLSRPSRRHAENAFPSRLCVFAVQFFLVSLRWTWASSLGFVPGLLSPVRRSPALSLWFKAARLGPTVVARWT